MENLFINVRHIDEELYTIQYAYTIWRIMYFIIDLECKHPSMALLMLSVMAVKARRPVLAQPNLISNLLKGLLLGQSFTIPEGLTPFEMLSAPLN